MIELNKLKSELKDELKGELMEEIETKGLLVHLSVDLFFKLQKELLLKCQNDFLQTLVANQNNKHEEDEPEIEYIYGLKELAKTLNCSKSHAARIKSSGILDAAISQNGKLLSINKKLAYDLFYNAKLQKENEREKERIAKEEEKRGKSEAVRLQRKETKVRDQMRKESERKMVLQQERELQEKSKEEINRDYNKNIGRGI